MLLFRYINQVYDQNKWRYTPIYLDRTWTTKFWSDKNFSWYLSVLEVNIALASGHFQNDGVVQPSLDFLRDFPIECLDNTIRVELGIMDGLIEPLKYQYILFVRKLQ